MHFNFQVHVRGPYCKSAGNNPGRSIEAGMEKILAKNGESQNGENSRENGENYSSNTSAWVRLLGLC